MNDRDPKDGRTNLSVFEEPALCQHCRELVRPACLEVVPFSWSFSGGQPSMLQAGESAKCSRPLRFFMFLKQFFFRFVPGSASSCILLQVFFSHFKDSNEEYSQYCTY